MVPSHWVVSLALLIVPLATSSSPSDGQAEPLAIQEFMALPGPAQELAQYPDLAVWVASLDPLKTLCARVVEELWIIGVSYVVEQSTTFGYYINLPLAAYGYVIEAAGNVTIDAEALDDLFNKDDTDAYLDALGIYWDTHEGIGTTSYARVQVEPLSQPVLCP